MHFKWRISVGNWKLKLISLLSVGNVLCQLLKWNWFENQEKLPIELLVPRGQTQKYKMFIFRAKHFLVKNLSEN